MSEPTKYSTRPVVLPGAVDAWLLEGTPAPGCKVCAALSVQRTEARARNDWAAACAAAREIRNHGHGHGGAAQ
ncbi:hypothetical protein SSP35_01_04070 [Streptomyces sp. NBRC 110611]|nr:hypothetical protein SSP35_01_04070 [Streptomyces sp. NBRC 110611]